MNEWWRTLSRRERRIVTGGLAVLLLVAGYLLIWEPWQQRLDGLRGEVADLRADLEWMRQAAPRLRAAGVDSGTAPAVSGVALATRIERSLRVAGLGETLRRIEPQSDGSLQLWLDNARFSELLNWLSGLGSGGEAELAQLDLDRRGGDRVDARLQLRGG